MKDSDNSKGKVYITKPIESNTITLTVSEIKEVLRFEKDQLFLYGEKVEIHDPKVIEGFRTWMSSVGYIKEK